MDFKEEHVEIEDIAHSLSNLCRHNGHINGFYSVSQHCMRVSTKLAELGFNNKIQLCGLLHDASEAYLGDLAAPIKHYLHDYNKLEKIYQDVIFRRFDIESEWHKYHTEIKKVDKNIYYEELEYFQTLRAESRKNINNTPYNNKAKFILLYRHLQKGVRNGL